MTNMMVAGYVLHDKKILLVYNKKLQKWLPFGGKIDASETPDSALIREAKEELNLDIVIFPISPIPAKKSLAVPFDANVVEVEETEYSVLYYLCKATDINSLKINAELLAIKWISQDTIESVSDEHVRAQCAHIFSLLVLQNT